MLGTWDSYGTISIHALLAESDYTAIVCAPPTLNFYPRSPCGERPIMVGAGTMILPFLSTLSLRRATTGFDSGTMVPAISIHALLAESDPTMPCTDLRGPRFLSTLSLRRATAALSGGTLSDVDFYPRSPCGERPNNGGGVSELYVFLSTLSLRRATIDAGTGFFVLDISIHALLAESDTAIVFEYILLQISIHALLAESDGAVTSPAVIKNISIHALLAESDRPAPALSRPRQDFYPRSPCGERRHEYDGAQQR